MEKQLVLFEVGKEYFGIDIAAVDGIIKMQKISRVPKAPEFVEGIINLRDMVLPVVSLEKRFCIQENTHTAETRIVVVNLNQVKIGMIVSAVTEVLTIDDSIIEPTPPIITSIDTQFIVGVAKIDTRLVILLDLETVLTNEEKKQAATFVSQS